MSPKKPMKINIQSEEFDIDIDEILEIGSSLENINEDRENAPPPVKTSADEIAKKVKAGQFVTEAVRDVIFEAVKTSFEEEDFTSEEDLTETDGFEIVKSKKKELYELLENLDAHVADKSVKEVSALFTSLLNIQGQLCMQKTEGIITVRTRLYKFFSPQTVNAAVQQSLQQEVSLMFTPEEIKAMRMKMSAIDDNDPLKPFFTAVMDQAYDVVQYNEMSGQLMLEMTEYFLLKLKKNGYGNTSVFSDFRERHERSKLSINKAIDDLRNIEIVINQHLRERPVLMELPRYLRALIQVKLGIIDKNKTKKILEKIRSLLGQYSRARSAVCFDFNRLPSFQHGVRLRQSIILNLHKDVLKYTGELFEKEFRAVKDELYAMLDEIETSSEALQPDTPEYQEMMKKKALIQKRLEEHRRRLDVVKSQQKLVDVQHALVGEAIERYQKNEALYQKLDEAVQNRPNTIDPDKIRSTQEPSKRKISRMVMARNRT
ncbi:MAG: hypothetical protein AB1656_22850 [Candidatus Omnitrophota bacterium]